MGSEYKDVFFWMGFCLLSVHSTESALGDVLTIVFPKGGIISAELLESDSVEHRRKTIGQLVSKLGRRATIHPSLADWLEEFVDRRNEFVHRFSDVHDLETDSGREAAVRYCQELGTEAVRLHRVLYGMLWARFEVLEHITEGAVGPGWDDLPEDLAESLKKMAALAPAMVTELKE